jgi:hypothetical protein
LVELPTTGVLHDGGGFLRGLLLHGRGCRAFDVLGISVPLNATLLRSFICIFELLACRCDVNKPGNPAKSVTEE